MKKSLEELNMKIKAYCHLVRLHKPVGIFLLLWPTLWALWLAGNGHPDFFIVMIFIAGVFVMRSAGCIINDFADRHIDGKVARTRERPLASRKITLREALSLFVILMIIAFLLVLSLNHFTILLAFVGALWVMIYPFMKRFTHLPQLGLGVAFTWGIPMAFAAQNNMLMPRDWFLFLTAALWPVIYDSFYAMADRSDDIKIGVKSTAILFGQWDKKILGILQIIFLSFLIIVGYLFQLHVIYYLSLIIAAGFFVYQQYLIRHREPANCFKAFINNQWVGGIIFLGIVLNYAYCC